MAMGNVCALFHLRHYPVKEEAAVLEILHAARFVDQPPQEIHSTLMDEGTYLCSVRTMYRILEKLRNGDIN